MINSYQEEKCGRYHSVHSDATGDHHRAHPRRARGLDHMPGWGPKMGPGELHPAPPSSSHCEGACLDEKEEWVLELE